MRDGRQGQFREVRGLRIFIFKERAALRRGGLQDSLLRSPAEKYRGNGTHTFTTCIVDGQNVKDEDESVVISDDMIYVENKELITEIIKNCICIRVIAI